MKQIYLKAWLLMICILCSANAWSQVKNVTGRVVSADNTPLPGVNIIVKGTTRGTQTDANGDFALEAQESDVMVFSFIGYATQEKSVGTNQSFTITLSEDITSLDEIVVVGYGEQSRKTVTSAIAKLDNQVLATAPRANVGSALQGTLPGLRVINSTGAPGVAPQILLRGGASIDSPGAPLVVVDGIIRPFNDIPAENIASVELLKDAASAAIYGARANNGVILITTKKGKEGTTQINYKYTRGFNRRRDGYNYLNAGDYIYYNRLGNLNSGRTPVQVNASRGYGLNNAADLASFDIRPLDATTQYLLNEGWKSVADPYNPGSDIIYKDHGGEVEDLVFRNAATNEHYLNLTGGNDRGTYFASFDYYTEDGTIVGSFYKRYTGDINSSYKLRKNLEVNSAVNLSTASQIGTVGNDINTLYRNLAIWPTFNPWLDVEKTKPNPGNGVTDGNPLYYLEKLDRNDEVNRITVNGSIKWDILPGLYIKGSGNAYLFEKIFNSFQRATQTYANVFATPPTFNNTSRNSTNYFRRDFQKQFTGILNYSKSLNDKHNINALIGAEYYGIKRRDMQVLGQNAPTDDIPTANASTTFPVVSAAFPEGTNYSSMTELRIISHFARLNYNYDQKYLLELTYRQDGASKLAEENRFGFFPGMSAGWNVQKENFFQGSGVSNFISTLKPRISYGELGNIAGIGNYDVQGIYGSQGTYNGLQGFLNTGIINSGLRWETSNTIDLGLDLGLINDRVTLIFDYFDRRTTDLLKDLTLPSYTGFATVKTNLGTFQNKGYEWSLNAKVLELSNGLTVSVGANATYVKNKILELPFNGNENNRQGGIQIYDPSQGKVVWVGGLQEGQPLGNIYGYKQVSIFADDAEVAAIAGTRFDRVALISGPNSTFGNGKITPGDVNWLDADQNDTIDSRDQVYLGNINPKWTGGFSANVSFKGFTLHARFDFMLGHTIYNDLVARTLGNYQGTFNYIDWQKRAWSPENPNADIPKVYYADQVPAPLGKQNYTRGNNANPALNGNNSRFYEKGDYMACREITLSYQFPQDLLSKTRVLKSARAFVSGNNLFYVTKFSGANPEPPIQNDVLTGVHMGTYPTPKTYVAGIMVSF